MKTSLWPSFGLLKCVRTLENFWDPYQHAKPQIPTYEIRTSWRTLEDSTMDENKHVSPADMEKAENISLADPALLEKIDKLFELNIGEDVALPQVRP